MEIVVHILPLRPYRPQNRLAGGGKAPAGAVAARQPPPVKTTPEIAAARLALCKACDHFNGAGCRLFGCCDKSLATKVTWAFSQCPANPPQWLRISVTVNPK